MNWTLTALIGAPLLFCALMWVMWTADDRVTDLIFHAILVVCGIVAVGIVAWSYVSVVVDALAY
jgi:hypothetical protein